MNMQSLLIVLAVVPIAICALNCIKVIRISRRKTASVSWPTAAGNVLSRDIVTSRNSKTHTFSYFAKITYSYAAPGGPYEKKLFLGSKGVRAQAQQLLDAVGDTIQVRYNPERPAEHTSEYEKITPSQGVIMIGSLILAVVLIVLAFN